MKELLNLNLHLRLPGVCRSKYVLIEQLNLLMGYLQMSVVVGNYIDSERVSDRLINSIIQR
jgi:hypothetical protein